MDGVRRVMLFCVLIVILPTTLIIIPLYLRNHVYTDVLYAVAESDVIQVNKGISSIFCQRQTLQMNTTFNAYQIRGNPEISQNRKHIRLKKSIRLPDDTLEYWGFFLLKGATVILKVCSRYEGSRILVVKGERNLQTCGLLEHNTRKLGANYAKEYHKVKVTFESTAQEIITPDSNVGGEITDNTPENEDERIYLETLEKVAEQHLQKKLEKNKTESNDLNKNVQKELKSHKKRHARKSKKMRHEKIEKIKDRTKRNLKLDINTANTLDRGVEHGGNAVNYTDGSNENSVSSFESDLLDCFKGQILLSSDFPPNRQCQDVFFLDVGEHMTTTHDVEEDGYYYYIFYSDNDFVLNDVHAIFDIHKPTYKYAHIPESNECTNHTKCSFPISMWANEKVIVEVPTLDGIEHEEDDMSLLVSTCHPRIAIYVLFPIAVLFFILICAFM